MENRSFYNEILTEHNLRPAHKHDLADANLVLEGVITLEKLVALMSANPRRIFALEGGVEEGDAADFTVLDLGAEYAVDPGTFLSKGRATPFAGWKVQGRAVLTVVGGREAYRDDGLQL